MPMQDQPQQMHPAIIALLQQIVESNGQMSMDPMGGDPMMGPDPMMEDPMGGAPPMDPMMGDPMMNPKKGMM